MTCTAEQYCAGECFGNTLWNCSPGLPEIVEFGIILVVFVVLMFLYEGIIQPWWRRSFGR